MLMMALYYSIWTFTINFEEIILPEKQETIYISVDKQKVNK